MLLWCLSDGVPFMYLNSFYFNEGTILNIALSMNDLSYLFIELDMQGKIRSRKILFDVPHKHNINISL